MDQLYSSFKKLSIFVTNPDYGVPKGTGECSKEKEIVDGLLTKVPVLASLRRAYIDFRKVLNGGSPEQLDLWIKEVQSLSRKKIDRFCNGLKKDILAVNNAIIYNWTNGLVEGCVNRLKNKKRKMYGRCRFQLFRLKGLTFSNGMIASKLAKNHSYFPISVQF